MTTKDEALRLADALEQATYLLSVERDNTAAELRRLHGENKRLKAAARPAPDYKALWQQMCERCDELDKELSATDRQVEILSDALAESRREVAALKVVQEPVAWYRDEDGIRIYYESKCWDDATPLYTTPPAAKRPWVGLTDGEVENFAAVLWPLAVKPVRGCLRVIEAKLKEKNNG